MNQKSIFVLATLVALASVASYVYVQSSQQVSSQPSLQTEDLTCLARSTIIARGQDWVNKKVPYSQSGTHDGYRTDCSGFVSMAWELSKPGLTTYTMHTVAHNIAKDQLQPGDALNCDSEHIVLFAGWSDSSKTHYVAMEETRPGEGTVKRVTPYPYWSNQGCFHPIRYNNAC